MRHLFIDTNVLIDVLLERDDYKSAARVLALSGQPGFVLSVSVLTMANVVYVLRKVLRGDSLYDRLNELSSIFRVQPVTSADYAAAVALRARDFEDSLQCFCARTACCDVIISRNVKDFTFSELPVLSPSLFLSGI